MGGGGTALLRRFGWSGGRGTVAKRRDGGRDESGEGHQSWFGGVAPAHGGVLGREGLLHGRRWRARERADGHRRVGGRHFAAEGHQRRNARFSADEPRA